MSALGRQPTSVRRGGLVRLVTEAENGRADRPFEIRRNSTQGFGALARSALALGVSYSYGFETVADPVSVKRDSSSASLALARSIDSQVVSTQPDPRFSPVSTLSVCMSSSCCCMLVCSCLHQATKRPGAAFHMPELCFAHLFQLGYLLTKVRF